MKEMIDLGFNFYDIPILDALFKQGVRVWSARVRDAPAPESANSGAPGP